MTMTSSSRPNARRSGARGHRGGARRHLHSRPRPRTRPALATGTTLVFFYDSHPFDDDVDFAGSRYRSRVNVHDTARNAERQLAIARRVFDAVKAEGWPTMLSFCTQGNIALYP